MSTSVNADESTDENNALPEDYRGKQFAMPEHL